MIKLLLCVFLGVGSLGGSFGIKERCDMIELNHYYDLSGKQIYDQVIYWRRRPQDGKYEVREWALVEDRESVSNRPRKDVNSGLWESYYKRQSDNYYLHVTAPIFKESHTMYDPERENKKMTPETSRIGLYNKKRIESIMKKEEEENGK